MKFNFNICPLILNIYFNDMYYDIQFQYSSIENQFHHAIADIEYQFQYSIVKLKLNIIIIEIEIQNS